MAKKSEKTEEETQAAAAVAPSKPFYLSFLAPVNQMTIQALLGAVGQQLMQGFDEVHLLLSTPGGEVQPGLAAYNVLRALPLKVIVYNVGSVNSIGNVIFLAGDERFSAPSSSFMFHGVGFDIAKARFEEKDLTEKLDGLQNDQKLIADVIARHTGMPENDVRELFLKAAFMPAADAKGRGIVNDVIDVQVPKGATFMQLVFQG